MGNNDTSSHHHQIIHAHPRPLLPRARQVPLPDTQFRPDLPALIQEHPRQIALLDPAHAAGYVRAVVEHERDVYLRFPHRFLYRQELLPQVLSRLGLSQLYRLGQGERLVS